MPSFETLLNRLHMIKPPLELLHVCIIQRTQRITLNAFEEYLGRLWRCRRIRLCSDDLLLRSTRLLRRRSIRGAAEKRRPAPKSPIGHSTMLLGIQDLHRRGAFPRCVRRRRPLARTKMHAFGDSFRGNKTSSLQPNLELNFQVAFWQLSTPTFTANGYRSKFIPDSECGVRGHGPAPRSPRDPVTLQPTGHRDHGRALPHLRPRLASAW